MFGFCVGNSHGAFNLEGKRFLQASSIKHSFPFSSTESHPAAVCRASGSGWTTAASAAAAAAAAGHMAPAVPVATVV